VEGRQSGRQQDGGKRWRRSDPERATPETRELVGGPTQLVDVSECLARERQQRCAYLRERDTTRLAIEQQRPELVLEALYLGAERGLRDV
jgi:hypothetical protein